MYKTSKTWYNKYKEKYGETVKFLSSQKDKTLSCRMAPLMKCILPSLLKDSSALRQPNMIKQRLKEKYL